MQICEFVGVITGQWGSLKVERCSKNDTKRNKKLKLHNFGCKHPISQIQAVRVFLIVKPLCLNEIPSASALMFSNESRFPTFLVACTRLYKTLCRSVGPSVHWLVGQSVRYIYF